MNQARRLKRRRLPFLVHRDERGGKGGDHAVKTTNPTKDRRNGGRHEAGQDADDEGTGERHGQFNDGETVEGICQHTTEGIAGAHQEAMTKISEAAGLRLRGSDRGAP